MKRILCLAATISLFLAFISPLFLPSADTFIVRAADPPPASIPSGKHPTQQEVGAFVMAQAWVLGVNPILADFIVRKESRYGLEMSGDDGQSRGYWQISRVWHPEVSDQCAADLKCSTFWSLKWILQGHAREWSTFRLCRKLYADCPF